MSLPPELTAPPEEPNLDPPVDPAVQELPFSQLQWSEFEKLCLRLAEGEGDVVDGRRFGVSGQGQEGIDLYTRACSGEYTVVQCRKVAKLAVDDLAAAVTDFLGGDWNARASRFILATAYPAVRRELGEAIVEHAKRLREREPSVTFEVWDGERLSGLLKKHPDLVRDFFGRPWLEAFLPDEIQVDLASQLGSMEETLKRVERGVNENLRVFIFDWSPEQAREELKALSERDATLFARLQDRIGNPPRAEAVVNLVVELPPWLVAADAKPWRILAGLAERAGEWSTATTAWSEAAARTDAAFDRAGLLVAAAITADVGGDEEGERTLLASARELAPDHPRLALQELDQNANGESRLRALSEVSSDDPSVAGLLACHRGVAHLLVGDVVAARERLREAEALLPTSAVTRMLSVNIEVQQGRLNAHDHRPTDLASLTRAHRDALTLLDDLRAQRRHAEAVRVIMLGADALSLLDERKRAVRLIMSVTDDELAVADAKEVLGDAALRALGWREALTLTENASASVAIDRIRASALAEVGTWPQQLAAAETLDALVETDSPEAPHAAVHRLGMGFGREPRPPWNERAAEVLVANGFERPAVVARAFDKAQARDTDAAYELLEPYLGQVWGLLAKLQVARMAKDRETAARVAEALLTFGAAQDVRLACADALMNGGQTNTGRRVATEVARDQSCPTAIRSDAYSLLMEILADTEDWTAAKPVLAEWIELRSDDSRVNPWMPMVANRSRT